MKYIFPHILGKCILWLGALYSEFCFWRAECPVLLLIEPEGPETIFRFDANPALPHYMKATNPQVPGAMATDLYFLPPP